ncbi:MAG: glycosyl hydrolase 115 family protein [Roseburia sp.]
MEFELGNRQKPAVIFLEENCYSGVRKIARKVAGDVTLVTGNCPEIKTLSVENAASCLTENGIVVGTLGKSEILELLRGQLPLGQIEGKRECYLFCLGKLEGKTILVIAGSDKRGTIYGLFHLSECMGVSPWVRFADVVPQKREHLILTPQDNVISKEPSVKYRGFFINDEWPAFGSWTFEHFGGFTAEMYDLIFETLLRLKGNYLWPAMWTSSFTLDGPGDANARLADEYGIVMSNSHHEPCLRHSEEWDLVRGENTIYGNEWNYATNREGLLQYWRDGLLRSGKFENIITIGMRGERDSTMLGPDATLKQNIDLLKDIITEQRKLIAECVGEDAPQMLALYKEVEAYFYGNENAKDGLKDWDGLDGVTLMLCEDNFGNMRTLPTEDSKYRKGGWGMYYHFDYHGGPVSYEWVNSSYLPKVWDQMTEAYEFGIRDIWVVNVGDLKFQEYPLSFFMDLAYDYEKWGVSNPAAPQEYLEYWIAREFGGRFTDGMRGELLAVMKGYTRLNHNRKPEAMSPAVYHPVHYGETKRVLDAVLELEQRLQALEEQIPEELQPAFFELVYYPAMGSLNVQKLNLLSGLNHYYAGLGAVIANDYANEVEACVEADRKLTERLNGLLDGRWNGMGASEHIGFRNWNDEECCYPVRMYVTPANKRRIAAYVKGDGDVVTAGGDWTGKKLVMKQFLRQDTSEGAIVLLNTGNQAVDYEIECANAAVHFSRKSGRLEKIEEILVSIDKTVVNSGETFVVHYAGGNIRCVIETNAMPQEALEAMTFLEADGITTIEAEHYVKREEGDGGNFEKLSEYGKTRSGMKAYPCDRIFECGRGPSLTYRVSVEKEGDYRLLFYTAPANPLAQWDRVEFGLRVNGEEVKQIPLIPEGYVSGEPSCPAWCEMVLNQIRVVEQNAHLKQGLNCLQLQAIKPGFVLEKIVIVREEKELPVSYLGPEESYYIHE